MPNRSAVQVSDVLNLLAIISDPKQAKVHLDKVLAEESKVAEMRADLLRDVAEQGDAAEKAKEDAAKAAELLKAAEHTQIVVNAMKQTLTEEKNMFDKMAEEFRADSDLTSDAADTRDVALVERENELNVLEKMLHELEASVQADRKKVKAKLKQFKMLSED